ncbi:MAG TPA: Crp/Fnr family transcriptional regulator [Methylocella sp.]|nr:Crp/Fnr family transcriptional regulator [Methylocella sp.]
MRPHQGNLTPDNRLLRAFDHVSWARTSNVAERIEAKEGSVLCWAGDRIEHVYFPENAILSVLTILADGSAIETANIGREGAFGLFEAMYTHSSFSQCLVQTPGTLMRVPFDVLRYLFEHNPQIRALFVCYTEALRAQIQQTVACYASHTTQERLCRWLLVMADRAGQDLRFTHEFLAHILGANRKSVTLAMQAMHRAGLVNYQRGRIRILDRPGLEKASCECYAALKKCFEDCNKTQS